MCWEHVCWEWNACCIQWHDKISHVCRPLSLRLQPIYFDSTIHHSSSHKIVISLICRRRRLLISKMTWIECNLCAPSVQRLFLLSERKILQREKSERQEIVENEKRRTKKKKKQNASCLFCGATPASFRSLHAFAVVVCVCVYVAPCISVVVCQWWSVLATRDATQIDWSFIGNNLNSRHFVDTKFIKLMVSNQFNGVSKWCSILISVNECDSTTVDFVHK